MISGFSTKKIKSGQTLSDRLKKARQRKKISLHEAEAGSKVREKYLSAIEEGRWSELPQSVYTRNFVLAYAKFLKLELKSIKETFDDEMAFRKSKEVNKISYNQTFKETKVLITPKLLGYAGLTVSIVLVVGYIIFQLVGFAGNPDLKITSPDNNITTDNDAIELSGVTDVDTFVSVNEENIPVSGDGRFSTKLKLHQGVNVVKIQAVNKAKKESSQIYTVEYKPKTAAIENNINQ
jgi:cytoskeletal protein RodZ